jgi:Na+/proline symporter
MDNCNLKNVTTPQFTQKESLLTGNLSFLAYIIFTVCCSLGFVKYKRKKSMTKDTLQTTFNAGGEMSMSLLASTIVSQWTWAANLLGSVTAGVQVE